MEDESLGGESPKYAHNKPLQNRASSWMSLESATGTGSYNNNTVHSKRVVQIQEDPEEEEANQEAAIWLQREQQMSEMDLPASEALLGAVTSIYTRDGQLLSMESCVGPGVDQGSHVHGDDEDLDTSHAGSRSAAGGPGVIREEEDEYYEEETCCQSCLNHQWHATHAILVAQDSQDGERFVWSIRAHRKMRYPIGLGMKSNQSNHISEDEEDPNNNDGSTVMVHPPRWQDRLRFISWEPHIVTWHMCWMGVLASSCWFVNGLYLFVWPSDLLVRYITGLVGSFLWVVLGYLGHIEAINHSHAHIVLPPTVVKYKSVHQLYSSNEDSKNPWGWGRTFVRPLLTYGQWHSPIGYVRNNNISNSFFSEHRRMQLVAHGYPLVQDVATRLLITTQILEHFRGLNSTVWRGRELNNGPHLSNSDLMGRELDIRIGHHDLRVTVQSFMDVAVETTEDVVSKRGQSIQLLQPDTRRIHKYRWWTRHPHDYGYLAIVSSTVFWICTIPFFISQTTWYPQEQELDDSSSSGTLLFFNNVLQILACLGFVYAGHASVAESSGGGWFTANFTDVGYNISVLQTLGYYGFLLFAIFELPSAIMDGDSSFYQEEVMKWGGDFSRLWGATSLFFASILSCIEFASQHPIMLYD